MNQRELAKRAHTAVLHMCKQDDVRKLKTLCMKTPSLMCQSGLAQTVVFLRSRDRHRPSRREEHGSCYLEQVIKVMGRDDIRKIEQLQSRALELGVLDYIALTAEAQRATEWLRRFAQIEMQDIKEEDDRDE